MRVEGAAAALALSLARDGDIEVFLAADHLDELLEALRRAREALDAGGPAVA